LVKIFWDNVIRDINMLMGSFHKGAFFFLIRLVSIKYKLWAIWVHIRCKDFIEPGYIEKTGNMQNNGVSNRVYVALKEALTVKHIMDVAKCRTSSFIVHLLSVILKLL
jgi:hypothetical protein